MEDRAGGIPLNLVDAVVPNALIAAFLVFIVVVAVAVMRVAFPRR